MAGQLETIYGYRWVTQTAGEVDCRVNCKTVLVSRHDSRDGVVDPDVLLSDPFRTRFRKSSQPKLPRHEKALYVEFIPNTDSNDDTILDTKTHRATLDPPIHSVLVGYQGHLGRHVLLFHAGVGSHSGTGQAPYDFALSFPSQLCSSLRILDLPEAGTATWAVLELYAPHLPSSFHNMDSAALIRIGLEYEDVEEHVIRYGFSRTWTTTLNRAPILHEWT
ncbi:hypothetical protein BS17DRAFT_811324 [Gyrodon lividus]|nr:hypothetical protein BS17DRAFT_811324 [Gyrodon lividus]